MAINVRLQAHGSYVIFGLEDLVTHIEKPKRTFSRDGIAGYYYYDAAAGVTWCSKPFLRAKFVAKNRTCWIAFEIGDPATCLECLGREQL